MTSAEKENLKKKYKNCLNKKKFPTPPTDPLKILVKYKIHFIPLATVFVACSTIFCQLLLVRIQMIKSCKSFFFFFF